MRTDLAALVGARICHDLISPIGAIGNGVELLTLTSEHAAETPEFALINESVENANARIRFFRIAYGAASSDQMIGRQEVLSVLAASARGGRLAYFWNIADDQIRDEVRIAFLLFQCLETALPLGGTIDIKRDGNFWEIAGTGRRVDIQSELWEGLTNSRAKVDYTPAQVQFALLPSVLKSARRNITFGYTEATINVRF